MSHSCIDDKWICPICSNENSKYISHSTITQCSKCKESLSWDGKKVVTYKEWLGKKEETK